MELYGEQLVALASALPGGEPRASAVLGQVMSGVGAAVTPPPGVSVSAASPAIASTPAPAMAVAPTVAPSPVTPPASQIAVVPPPPYPAAAPATMLKAQARATSGRSYGLWIALVLTIVVAAGIGVAMRDSMTSKRQDDPWAGGGSSVTPPVTPPETPPVTPPVMPRLPGELISASTFEVRMPPGFTAQRGDDGSLGGASTDGVILAVGPVPSTDLEQVIARNIADTQFGLVSRGTQVIGGVVRPLLTFQGTANGQPYFQIAALFLDHQPPLGATILFPVAKASDPSIATLATEFFEARVVLK
jgi:hypothetical protein